MAGAPGKDDNFETILGIIPRELSIKYVRTWEEGWGGWVGG